MTATGSTLQTSDVLWDESLVSSRSPAEQVVLSAHERSALDIKDYAALCIKYAQSPDEQARKKLTLRRLRILQDGWAPLLKASFENWTTPEVARVVMGANRDHLDISRNPAKHIWHELSVLYKQPPKREVRQGKTDTKLFEDLVAGTHFDMWWQTVELLLNACNEVLIWPTVVTRAGKQIVKHMVLAGDRVTIVALDDDPTEIDAVLINDSHADLAGNIVECWRLWTDEWFAVFERDDHGDIKQAGKPDPDWPKNPYGELPFTLIRSNPWNNSLWDQTTGEDLVDLTLRGGEDRLFYRYLQKMQGFKQGVVTGNIDKMPQGMLDPSFFLKIHGDDIKFSVVDWQIGLRDRLSCMMDEELAAAASRGINPERYKRTASHQTAHAAGIAERGLSERRLRNAPLLKWAEAQYYRKLSLVARKHGLQAPDPDKTLEVEHAQIAYPDDPKTQLEMEKYEIAMGLESPTSIMKRRHPTWTDAECKRRIEENLEEIAKVNDMKAKHNVPDDPTNLNATAEFSGRQGPVVRDSRKTAGSSPVTNDEGVAGNE